jgi:signal transduction histidine kinase
MIGVSERAQLLGGRLVFHSELGHGTMVSVKIPLGRDRHGP